MTLDAWPLLMELRKQDPHRNVIMAAVITLRGVRQVRRFFAEYSEYVSYIRQLSGVAEWKDSAVIRNNIVWTLERATDAKGMALWLRALPCLTAGNNGGTVESASEEKS